MCGPVTSRGGGDGRTASIPMAGSHVRSIKCPASTLSATPTAEAKCAYRDRPPRRIALRLAAKTPPGQKGEPSSALIRCESNHLPSGRSAAFTKAEPFFSSSP